MWMAPKSLKSGKATLRRSEEVAPAADLIGFDPEDLVSVVVYQGAFSSCASVPSISDIIY